mmetsp:Transcript_28805/g.70250  ORF Transcript_28805/g.70250 Transcript_28805/m.70250 type:complete len:390 (+) Transcript_28805:784-1953(+)
MCRTIHGDQLETEMRISANRTHRDVSTRVELYMKALDSIGLEVTRMDDEGGHSLYRALSHQIFGTATNFKAIRIKCNAHIQRNKDYFQHFVDVEFEKYLAAKKKGTYVEDFYAPGDHLDLQAVCEIYDCSIAIFSTLSDRPLDEIVFYPTSEKIFGRIPQILLSYTGNDHYDSVFNEEGVPLKISTSSNKNMELHQLENNNRRTVINARQAEFRRMKRFFSSFKKNLTIHSLNTLDAYTSPTFASTATYAMLRGTQKQRIRDDELKSKGRNLNQILKYAGIQLDFQPNDVWKHLLAPLSYSWPSIEALKEENNKGVWKKYVSDDREEPTIQIGFLLPEEKKYKRNSGMVFEIRAEIEVASRLAEALDNLFDKSINFELQKMSVVCTPDE